MVTCFLEYLPQGIKLNYRDFLGRFPARPTESPFFARRPSVFGRWSRSRSKVLAPFCFTAPRVLFAFVFCGPASGIPILVGLMAFFALRMEALIAPWSVSSSSVAIFLRFARRVRPANFSRLGCGRGYHDGSKKGGWKP